KLLLGDVLKEGATLSVNPLIVLLQYLYQQGFNIVGDGCTTCIGNSGDLHEPDAPAIADNNMIVIYVKYDCNFGGDIDFEREPIGTTNDGNEVFFRDVWPSASVECVARYVQEYIPSHSTRKSSVKYVARFDRQIELFSPEVKVVFIAEFLYGAINRMVGGITFQESDIEELKSNWQFTRLSLRWPESVESNV
ncbi:aconitate hydratase, cytoplasmic, partial [Tanacetum coccineum]